MHIITQTIFQDWHRIKTIISKIKILLIISQKQIDLK